MSERATVFEAIQWGLEATAGTEADAGKRMEAYGLSPNREGNIDTFRPEGLKFPTLVTIGKEYTTAGIDGILDYANVVYPLASLINYDTANIVQQGTTTAYKWTFNPDTDGPDTVATYTVEKGSSVRAEQFEYGTVTGFGFSFNASDSQIAVTGDMIGTQLRDGITMTSSPTTVEAVPVHPNQCTVKVASAQASLSGASALTRVLAVEWNYTGKSGPLFTVGTAKSFIATVETVGEISGTLTLEADSNGMAYLTTLQAGTQQWMQIKFTGATISGAYAYDIQIQFPFHFSAYPPLEDSDGVVAVSYAFTGVHDGTWGKALDVQVINTLTGL